jgi:hypothetical protein
VFHLGRLLPYSQALNYLGILARFEHSSLLHKIVTYDRKKFNSIGPRSYLAFGKKGNEYGKNGRQQLRLGRKQLLLSFTFT